MVFREQCRVAVIGAGISGLAAAGTLLREGGQRIQVTLLDRASSPGGWVRSGQRNGCVYELGPRTIRSASPTVPQLLSMVQECGLADQVISVSSRHPAARNRYILLNGRPVPIGRALVKSLLWPRKPFRRSVIGSVAGQLLRRAPQPVTGDISLDEFGRSRLGDDLTDFLLDPMMRGIFAGRISSLSVRSAAPFMLQLEREHSSLLAGLLLSGPPKIKQHDLLPSDSSVWSLRSGLGSLPDAYLHYLQQSGVQCQLGVKVESIRPAPDAAGCRLVLRDSAGSSSTEQSFHHVIACTPAFVTGDLLGGSLGHRLKSELEFATVAVVSLLFNENVLAAAGVNGFGHLVPSSSSGHFLGVIYDSCVLSQHMPADFEGSQVTCMLGGAWYESIASLNEKQLINLALDGLAEQLGTGPVVPAAANCNILKHCIPQYPVGHQAAVSEWRSELKRVALPVQLAGCSYDGVSVPDCANSGVQQARLCLQSIGQ